MQQIPMKQILVYADSLSWGIIPNTRLRLPFDARWPGVLELALNAHGNRARVIEDCLNGRRTMWDDPLKAGRNGLQGLAQRIEVNSPLALVILMLGTNDFQSMHDNDAQQSAHGLSALIQAIRTAPIEPGMPIPPILVVVPPAIAPPKLNMAEKFAGGDKKCAGLAAAYQAVCQSANCAFFDANSVVSASKIDGVHLDADAHLILGKTLVAAVAKLI